MVLMSAGLLTNGFSEIGTHSYFTDTETATANVIMTGTWESICMVGDKGDGIWNSPCWQVSIYAGEKKETAITFANSYVEDIAVTLSVLAESDDDGNLIFGIDNPAQIVPAGGEITVVLWVEASQSVTPGAYSANITLER